MQKSSGNKARNPSRSRKPNASGRRGFQDELDFSWNSTPVDAKPVGWNIRNTPSECSRVNNFEEHLPSRSSYSRRERSHRLMSSGRHKSSQYSEAASTSLTPAMVCDAGLCRTEQVEVFLEASPAWAQHQTANTESRRYGSNPFGFSLQPASPKTRHDEPLTDFPLIASVIPGGPAFQSGVIQAGDSLLAIQGDSPLGKTIDKLTTRYLLSPSLETSTSSSAGRHLSLVTQYTVAENVIPSSGVFDVRIIKRSASLGINLQASRKSRPGEPLLISKVIPGSVASRCGSISPGDILLAVNGVSLEACSITDAARLLQTSEEIVTLRIQKPDGEAATPISDEGLPSCCQSDLEVVRDDDNDFSLGGGGPFDMNIAQDDEFLSQSADESISHLPAPPPRPPRRYRGQRDKRTQQHRHGAGTARNQQQQVESENGSDGRRGNPSDSFSSDRFSENMCSDTLFEVHKVRLTRSHPSCPWGVVISGTDDVVDAPIYIDSLTPGKPAAISGLLRRGDRILAVNGLVGAAPKLAGGAGLTLSLVTARLQQPFESVTLYIAREKSRSDFPLPSTTASTSALSQGNSNAIVKQYSWGASGSSVTEFNQSFDEERVRPPLRTAPSTSSTAASTTRLKKQNSISKGLSYPRQLTGAIGFLNNADNYDANFNATSYLNISRPTELPRQTIDAYLSKGGESLSRHQHHHHRHKSHNKRWKTSGSNRHHRRHGKQEEQNKDLQRESKIQRASSTLNLDDIACPGCREAVVNEVLNQQRIRNEQRSDRCQVTRQHGHLRTRGRSLEMVDTQSVSTDTRAFQSSSHRSHQHQHQHHPPPIPTPLEVRSHGSGREGYQTLSRSDSRLNREHLDTGNDDEGSVSPSVTGTRRVAPLCEISSSQSSYTSSSGSGSFSKSDSSRSSSLSSTDLLEAAKNSVPAHRTFSVTPLPSNGKQRSHRSIEALPRGTGNPLGSESTTPTTSKQRLHRSASREGHKPSWKGWIRLVKPDPGDSFGIGLSKGLSSRGIYVSAIRPGSVADTSGLLQIYDRILKVNELSTKGRTCREVVAMIRRSSPVLDLFVHRRR
nr:glutamate receptor interacting protein [Hymenolepis microstoma]